MKIRNNQILILLVIIIISCNFIFILNNINNLKVNKNSNNTESSNNSNSNNKNEEIDNNIRKLKENNQHIINLQEFKHTSKILLKKKRNEIIMSRECEYVDLVYTWVNGSDPEHMKSKAESLKKINEGDDGGSENIDDINSIEDFEPHRFRDIGGLKYSLRSVRQYAPWIKNIFIITANQIPTWFNTEKPDNVKFIFHKNYYHNDSHLPTFNSNSIESNFWNLPEEVSNCFLYLNDDVFFRKPVLQSDYFDENFNQVIYEVTNELVRSEYKNFDNLETYFKSFVLSNRVIDEAWGVKQARSSPDHGVQVYNRKIWSILQEQLSDSLESTSSNKVRKPNDLQMSFIYNQFAKRYSFNYTIAPPNQNLYVGVWNDDTILNKGINRILNETERKTVCLNDGFDFVDESIHTKITNLFEYLFPIKSPFELN